MKLSNKKVTILVTIILGLSLMLAAGCTQTADQDSKENGQEQEAKGTVKLAYVNWAEGVAMTNLAQAILEDEMGYSVETTMADPAPVFTSIANGDQDAFLDAWLPVTHESYMEEYGDDLVDLGYNFEGARIGLVVPEYVDINSIEEMNSVSDKFNGQIIGIDSGAGIMKATDTAIDEYGLDYELLPGSGPAMTAALKDAVENDEWVAVTGWKPHWKFARWNLKFLEDPKKIYGAVENVHTVARKGLEDDMPEVAQFLKNFKLNDQQLGSLMGIIADSDGDAIDAARDWMKENGDLVKSWIE